jgi:N-methylhydantoinase A/oxoprolinase/acetone carboxylase beta subunit
MSEASERGLWLGLDTGGTFTDAVLLADGREVIASAKALTTPWNLAIGISEAIHSVLGRLPAAESSQPGVRVDHPCHECRG